MNTSRTTFDAQATASLLDYTTLVNILRETIVEYGAGRIVSPERLAIPLQQGGLMLSMPSSAEDIAIHKLVNVCPGNITRNLPTINGQVIACDAVTGEMKFVLDGPTVTGRRTAAVSALGAMTLTNGSPREILVIGTGKQASNHVEAFATLFPDARLLAKGISADDTRSFVERQKAVAPRLEALQGEIPDSVDVVVTVTTSKKPVYDEAVRASRLVIGVGAFTPDAAEISKQVVDNSFVVVDDPVGAKHEAGDLIQARFDWTRAGSLAQAIQGQLSADAPIFFKSVGCAAWDLAACRVARQALN
ncbi:bifunctional Delta(1)-pyrroline-2-carboxylate/Delta(1)-piperideine-2-carboxylate reductase [Paraburkholderia susongensis]|uniref:Ornithine cyclodeaminase n=1 Tax=Paraburkholderia susongensis TaxID=1515439 RepID=A0A1X7HZT1_9BURK|nr:bifunctional Delta(1)-pyrroline-2-carboxylate/Delta(1)-piperideine-2-carboxylate reductase [Paraburkholderia susongensis]SMG07540.1 ornithine cyclodeaminase [Paraburkholderia susongensis]